MTIVRIFRPDVLQNLSKKLINAVLGNNFFETSLIDLEKSIEQKNSQSVPVLLCAAKGYDPSFRVDKLVRKLRKKYKQVAIGSQESYLRADKAIEAAASRGS